MAERFVASDVRLRTPNWKLLGLSLLGGVLGVAGFVWGPPPGAEAPSAMIVFAALMVGLFAVLNKAFEKPGELSAGAHGVDFAGQRYINLATLKQGLLLPDATRKGQPVVELALKSGSTVQFVVRDAKQGHDLLGALGLDPSKASFEARVLWRHTAAAAMGTLGIAAVLALVLGATVNPRVGFLFFRFAPLMTFIPYLFLRAKLRIGADGLYIDEPGRHRFFGYREIDWVRALAPTTGFGRRNAAVEVVLQSGEKLTFRMTARQAQGMTRALAIADRAREAIDNYRRNDDDSPENALHRAGKPIGAWIQSLRSAGAGGNMNPRTAPALPGRLWQIVEDAGSDPRTRAAAAVALGPTLDDAGRDRLRAISETSALPKLRIALGAAATPEQDEEMERAMEELEADEEAARAESRA